MEKFYDGIYNLVSYHIEISYDNLIDSVVGKFVQSAVFIVGKIPVVFDRKSVASETLQPNEAISKFFICISLALHIKTDVLKRDGDSLLQRKCYYDLPRSVCTIALFSIVSIFAI